MRIFVICNCQYDGKISNMVQQPKLCVELDVPMIESGILNQTYRYLYYEACPYAQGHSCIYGVCPRNKYKPLDYIGLEAALANMGRMRCNC